MVLTRRAHRARMLITLWLPNEVLTEIIRHATTPDQATFCRVSKLFHGLVLPIVNRAIFLDLVDKQGRPYDRILKNLMQSFIRNPGRADAVRSLTFLRTPDHVAQVNYDLLFETMKLMKNLECLSLNDFRDNTIPTRLAGLTFPNLSWCRIMVTNIRVPSAATDFAKFLGQHPSIVRLFLWAPPLFSATNSLEPGLTFLPNLRHYQGSGMFLDRLSTRCLQAARFATHDLRIESDVQALRPLTNPDLPFVLSLEFLIWGSDNPIQTILLPLTVQFPHIWNLQLRAYDTDLLGMTALDHVTTHLPRFTQIVYFALTYANRKLRFAVDAESDDAAFETWAATCPTLKGCCIGEVARRKVGEEWERWSVEDFDQQAGFSVFDPILSADE
ncbi:hypothetical protein FB45DRAFT_920070 [Roridomyces roridus]|uniref:F-box domain-containing protein n=1 Tax=Roridomyces roridus TaxID=1738132 RepID=A0AAD7BP42_9AGAR|nr:hypothetical protein FB45DRAFT_920070 [Roridomyces roridus]